MSSIILTTEQQQLLTSSQARKYNVLPKQLQGEELTLYIADTANALEVKEELEVLLGHSVHLIPSQLELINEGLTRYYRYSSSGNNSQTDLRNIKGEHFLESLIAEAKRHGSSDIHIEIYEKRCRVRIRIDGYLVERYVIDKEDYPSLINKIKIKARLDIAEKRLPQDGRIFFKHNQEKFDIRVSILPTLHGEKIVMRLLNNDAANIDIQHLGMTVKEQQFYLEGVKKPHGIILISGPTGSGKTTTLYATLKLLNEEKRNIVTVEDPIEYTLEGINQVQVKENINLTFANALRSFLRQDPDVIMLGEIRDAETAEMAIRAALTGHLVLSTIHTNSAWATVSRLIDMGIKPYLLASTLNTTVAQRLVGLLCNHCKEEQPFSDNMYPMNYKAPKTIKTHYIAKGCEHCYYKGYKGRKAVYEIIPVTNSFSEKIKSNTFDISGLMKQQKIHSLSDNAFQLFAEGITSIEEVYPLLSVTE